MKAIITLISLISLLSSINTLPHFTYDGLESFRQCLGETDKISFTIYGSLSEEINPEKMYIKNYIIEDMGEFQCSLSKNEDTDDEKRTHKIVCTITGSFERRAYILEEPIVYGFDFKNEKGESTWPKEPENKTFLIGECGQKIELDLEPLLLGNLGSYINPIQNVRKDIVDKAISSLPSRTSVSKNNMIESMKNAKKSYSLSQIESAYMVYKWIAKNFVYDCYNFNHDRTKIDYSEDGTYSKGKGVCDGFAKLLMTMCNSLDIEAVRVVGYSKGSGYTPGILPTQTDHAWNAIKLGSNYYLIDVTWGAGSCNGDTYKENFRDSYFCSNPDGFIRGHLPAESQYQLISPTITLQQFVDMLKINMEFYEYGFIKVNPDLAKFNTEGKITVEFNYESSNTQKTFLSHLYFLQSNTYVEQSNACWIDRQETKATLTCYANNKGTYKLKIYGGPSTLETYPLLLEYDIICTKTAFNPMGFPTIYGLFSESDMIIVEPLYNPLTRGNFINFNIKTTTFDNLYIVNKNSDKNHFRELDNNGNGVFTGESVYIFGQNVYIATLKDNYYNYIVEYTTIRDSSSAKDATFPESFSAPKNILYSPLTDTLTKGKIYNFKIKCESATKIAVLESNNFTYLDKSGSTFSGFVKIEGLSSTISIVSMNGNRYSTYYRYKVNK